MAKQNSTGKKLAYWPGRPDRSRAQRGPVRLNGQAGEAGLPCLQVITSHPEGKETDGGASDQPFRLSGSARRSAFALEANAIRIVEVWGVDRTLFVTLTFGGGRKGPSIKEAEAAFNRFQKHALSRRYSGGIKVLERGGKKGRVHFHLLLDAGVDVRTGANFGEIDAENIQSLNAACRTEYSWLRKNAPRYGFGKIVNSLPIKSTKDGIARYVSKYIKKHLVQRRAEDKRARLCSYWGTARKNRVCCSLKFSWAGIGGWLFRAKLAGLSGLNGINDQDGWAERLGPRWAFQLQRFIRVYPLTRWPTGMHAFHDGIRLGQGVDLAAVVDVRSNEDVEIRNTKLHGKPLYWLSETVPEPGWVERGRAEQALKRATIPQVAKVEWADHTVIHGDAIVSRTRTRYIPCQNLV